MIQEASFQSAVVHRAASLGRPAFKIAAIGKLCFNQFEFACHQSTMPCRPEEQFAHGPEQPNPVTPTKSTGNDGACHADQDAENSDAESDLEVQQKRKKPHTVLSYVVVKRWVTGEWPNLMNKSLRLNSMRKHAS